MNTLTIPDIQRLIDTSLHEEEIVPMEYRKADAMYHRFLLRLAHAVQPELIVELGTLDGRSTVHFAHGAPNARILGIDWNPPTNIDAYPNLNFWQGDTRLMGGHVAALKMKIGILFIDSTHITDHALLEYNCYSPLVAKGGVMLFDDIYMREMSGLWGQIPEPKFASDTLHSTCGFGIAIKG
jgi:predicted O-methyltransferase YrrM